MQAIILSAGKGERLFPLTKNIPKCFITLSNKPIIDYQLKILKSHKIRDIIVVIGYKAKTVERELSKREVTIVLNPFYETTNVLTSLWFAKEKLIEDFIFMHGDTVFDLQIFENMLDMKGDVVLPIEKKKCSEEDMKVITSGSQVVEISKEIPLQDADGEFIGIAKVGKNVLKDLKDIMDEFMCEGKFDLFFEAAIQKLIDKGCYSIMFTETEGYFWEEIDFPHDLDRARRWARS